VKEKKSDQLDSSGIQCLAAADSRGGPDSAPGTTLSKLVVYVKTPPQL
jgi:hypothetical protein